MQREDAGAASITVDAPGFHGTLEELVAKANRGDVDLTELSVSAVVEEARSALESPERQGDLRGVADALTPARAARRPQGAGGAARSGHDGHRARGRSVHRRRPAARRVPALQGRRRGAPRRSGNRGREKLPRARLHRGHPGRAAPNRAGAPGRGVPRGARTPQRHRAAPGGDHLLGGGQGPAAPRPPRAGHPRVRGGLRRA